MATSVNINSKNIYFDKQFHKDWKHLKHESFKNKFITLLEEFEMNPFNEIFRNHELHKEYEGLRSIDITGDIRAIYYAENENYIFLRIGTHSYLYG